jgi:hypothetical protein
MLEIPFKEKLKSDGTVAGSNHSSVVYRTTLGSDTAHG